MTDSAAKAPIERIGGTRTLTVVILLVAAFFSFTRIGSASLWDDEAYVAITARNLLRFGKFTVWDGRNVYVSSADRGYNLRVRVPPLDTVLAAASFRLFGQSEIAARLPFALANLCTLAAFIFLLRRWFPTQNLMVNYAVALLGLSTQFLLIGRNARYYALAVLFGLLTYAAYRRVIRAPSVLNSAALAVAAFLMFYSHPLSTAAMLVALCFLHVVFFIRSAGWRSNAALGVAAVLFLAGAIPIAIGEHLGDFALPHNATSSLSPLAGRILLVWYEQRELSQMSALPWVLLIGIGIFLWATRKKSEWRPVRTICLQMLSIALIYTLAMGLLSPTPPKLGGTGDIRYLFAVLPFGAVALACFFAWFHTLEHRVALAVLAVTLGTSAFEWTPFRHDYTNRVRLLLPGLLSEVLGPYPTATESVSTILRNNAKQDDIVETFPTYWSYPLIYYVGDRVRVGGLLSHSAAPPAELLQSIHAPLFMEDIFPQWVICYGFAHNPAEYAAYFGRPHMEGGLEVHRRYYLSTIVPLYPAQTQRPELPWHSFGPRPADEQTGLVVYVLKSDS